MFEPAITHNRSTSAKDRVCRFYAQGPAYLNDLHVALAYLTGPETSASDIEVAVCLVEQAIRRLDRGQIELTPALVEQVITAMAAAWDAGEPWSRSAQSGERRASRRMVSDFGIPAEQAEKLLTIWQEMGLIEYRALGSRPSKAGYCVRLNDKGR